MGFFEFDEADEWYEDAETPAARPQAPPRRPAPSSGTTSRPPTSSGSGSRPTTPSTRPAPSGGRPAPRPPSGRPTSPATRPTSPSSRPTSPSSPPSTDWAGRLAAGFDTAMRYVPQAIDVGTRTADIVRQFQQPSPGPAPAAPSPDAPFPIAPGPEPFGGHPPVATEPEPVPPAPAAPPAFGAPPLAAPPGPPQAFAAPRYGAPPVAAPPQGFDQLAMLLQALQQRQIPPLPSFPPSYFGGYPPSMYPQPDPMSALQSILGHPHFQQALQWSAMGSGPRHVQLPLPAPGYPGHARSVAIPMGAVMNTVSSLATQARNQMNATTREDEAEVPEYLVDEQGDFIVDPARPDDRSALVEHLFRLSDEAYRSGWFGAAEADGESAFDKEDAEIDCQAVEGVEGADETEQWAREAGFTR